MLSMAEYGILKALKTEEDEIPLSEFAPEELVTLGKLEKNGLVYVNAERVAVLTEAGEISLLESERAYVKG